MLRGYEDAALSLLYSDRKSVIQFFIVMSRFEYAVKRAGYIQCNGFVAWQRFAKTLEKVCVPQDATDDLFMSIKYLDEHQPRKLNSDMSWDDWDRPGFDSSFSRAFMSITQVRNNLFHGRKGADLDRNDQLIKASLVVLGFLLASDSKLERYFLHY